MITRRRPITKPRSGSRRWTKLSRDVARKQPMCWLRLPGCTIRSTGADHYWPVKYRPDLEFVESNCRGACHHCNVTRGSTLPADIPALRAKLEAKAHAPRKTKALGFFS